MLKKSAFWKVFTVLVCLGIVVGLFLSWFNKPLAPALALNVPAKAAGDAVKSAPQAEASNCGQTGDMVIMFVSYDSAGWALPHGSDMVRYFRADFSNLIVDEVAIPRDLKVNTPALADQNILQSKLGEVFEYEPWIPLSEQKEKIIQSTTDIAQTAYDNFQVTPDYYMTLDATSFVEMINEIGGVDIDNTKALQTASFTYPVGKIHLTGTQASDFSRWLNDGLTEWDRFDRQHLVLDGLWEKMTKAENIIKLPELNDKFSKYYITDLSPAQITSLFCLVEKVSLENIAYNDVTPEMMAASAVGVPVTGELGVPITGAGTIADHLQSVLFPAP